MNKKKQREKGETMEISKPTIGIPFSLHKKVAKRSEKDAKTNSKLAILSKIK
jgi:hypothetical protein